MKAHMMRGVKLLFCFCLALVGILLLPKQTAYAATVSPVQIAGVEYYYENVTVFNNGNTRIYYATEVEAAKDNWDVIPADSGGFTVIDMSWLSPTVENIIKIKGDLDETQTRFVMKERPRKLEISINYQGIDQLKMKDTIGSLVNIMTTEGSGSNPVTFDDLEWRKGVTGQWVSTQRLTRETIEKFLIRGAYLYFRIRAVNDYVDMKISGSPIDLNDNIANGIFSEIATFSNAGLTYGSKFPDGLGGRRFSSEVKVKIAKTAPSMVYGIDGEDFTADIKYGKEYRVTTDDENGIEVTSKWIKVTDRSTKSLTLKEIINNGVSDGATASTAFPAMKLEIRDYATSKAAASKITEIELNAQRILSGTVVAGRAPSGATSTNNNIYVDYNGTKNMVITIPSASLEQPYEYCVIKPHEITSDDKFDFKYAVWSSITKGTEVKVLPGKAVQDGMLYIRKKEIKSKAETRTSKAVSYALASTFVKSIINYPSNPVAQKATFTYIKKYTTSTPISFTITCNEAGKKPFETEVKNIKLGTKEINFTQNLATVNGVSTITVTLSSTSLEAMTNSSNRPITINYMNGTVDKTSIKLTIQNATPAGSLSALPAEKGTGTGTTAITLVSTPATGNKLVYTTGASKVESANIQDILTGGSEFKNGVDIPVVANNYITIYEIDDSNHIIKFKSIQITSNEIR